MDGIIIINKTKGCTSHDIVYKIKKMLNKKVGHTGTLDPMAEGVLPILIGKGTQLSKYLINHDKKYIVELQLGIKTDTADSEGKIIEEKTVNKTKLSKENITNVLQTFIGKQEQIPPIYSAIKVNGKKLYEYARKGQEVELKPRQIEIYDIKLIDYSMDEKQIKFEVFCGKGTYIRSLCEDIATKFETVGYMKSLKRTQVGNFKIDNSITIEELKNLIENNENIDIDDILKNKIITVEEIFEKFQSINLDEKKLEMFLNGVMLTQNLDEGVYKIYNKNSEFIGTGTIKNKLLKRDIIL
ncbi:tRNA pseudouridine synthase B [Clostridium sp. CAG:389]|nr:tRNA pseudouridine synthase B [Clostridium sp. CAG:389]